MITALATFSLRKSSAAAFSFCKIFAEEVERMQREAESHAEEDQRRLAEVDARNRLDTLIYQTEKLVKENQERFPESDRKAAEEAVAQGRRALSEGGIDKLNAAIEAITQSSHKLAEALYQTGAAGAAGQPHQPGPSGPAEEPSASQAAAGGSKPGEVIDAEFVDVDDSKKPN